MADFQIISKAVDEIERTLRDFSYGWRNEEALRNIEQQVRTIRREAGSMAYIDEKLGSLIDWVDKLYSHGSGWVVEQRNRYSTSP